MAEKPKLIALHYSPWSERARWSLDHHKVDYEYNEHVPMLGELWLRLQVSNFESKVSVPSLVLPNTEALTESVDIAHYAEKHGSGASLFCDEGQVSRWLALFEKLLRAARIRTTNRIRDNAEALKENMPEFIPELLHTASIPIAWLGSSYLLFKYDTDDAGNMPALEEKMREVLKQLDKALQKSGKFLLKEFSFADMAAASMLQFVKPVNNRYIYLGENTRHCWTEYTLASEFADVLAWRDQIYKEFR